MPKRKQQRSEDPSQQVVEEEDAQDVPDEPSVSKSDSDSAFSSSASEDDSEEESEDDEDGEAFDSINVDFEFFNPQEKDFHGLKALLRSLLDGEQYSCSELVDAIIEQESVGTVIKCGEEEDPIGVSTVFHLPHYSRLKSLAEFKEFLLAHCPDGAGKASLKQAWSAPGSGLIINERLINCPPQLAPHLQRNLFDEIEAAAEEESAEGNTDYYKFLRYIVVARVYVDPEEQPGNGRQQSGGKGGQQKKGKTQKQAAAMPSLVYTTPEADCFHTVADWSFTFPSPNRLVGKHDLVPYRLVLCVPAAKVPQALRQLEALLAAGSGGGDED